MPYFQRATVETTFKPGERARVARGSDQVRGVPVGEAAAPATPGMSVVERAVAILAREPAFGEGLWPATTLPDQMLSALLPRPPQPDAGDVPLLEAPAPVAAGATARLPLTLANDDDAPVVLVFRATDLLSSEGESIPSARVAIRPREVTLPARSQHTVHIEVDVPAGKRSGTYAGLIQTVGHDLLRSVISLEVTG